MSFAESFNYVRLRWDRGAETLLQLADEHRVGAEPSNWWGLVCDDDAAQVEFDAALEDLSAARAEWSPRYDELLAQLQAEVLRRSGTPAERVRRIMARRKRG